MNQRISGCGLLALTFVSPSCEITRDKQMDSSYDSATGSTSDPYAGKTVDEILSGGAANPAPAKPALQPPAKQETPPKATAKPVNRTRFIDGRTSAPAADKAEEMSAARTLYYRFGDRPADLMPEWAPFEVPSIPSPLATPAKQANTPVSDVMLAARSSGWEAGLIERGVSVLDRKSLPELEREFFIQDAADGEPSEKPTSYESEVPWESRARWQSYRGVKYPRLSGQNVEASRKLSHGKVLPAQWLLQVGEVQYSVENYKRTILRPTAEYVTYRAEVNGARQLPSLAGGSWKASATDPFLFECSGAPVYFDPATERLWTLDRAYVGGRVSRDEYIRRRTKSETPTCPECKRPVAEKSVVTGPDEALLPKYWYCSTCNFQYDVTYFDGYSDSSLPQQSTQAILRWRWLEPEAGVYAVRVPRTSGPESSILLHNESLSVPDLLKQADSAPSANTTWCIMELGRSALIIEPRELWYLRLEFGREQRDSKTIPLPVVDGAGRQVFKPSATPYEQIEFSVPVAQAAVEARLINTETSEVAMSGVLALSYLNLLPRSFPLPIGPNGPIDLSWPSLGAQQAQLGQELQRRLADYVAK